MKHLLLALVLLFSSYSLSSQCVTYYNGVTNDTEFKNAAEYLCNNGIIPSTFNVSHLYDWITKKELAVLLCNTLFPSGSTTVNNYPIPFYDINSLNATEKNAMLTMLTLEYPHKNLPGNNDGITPLPREYFNIKPNNATTNDVAMRMFFESFNYTVDWTGYDKLNGLYTNFYYDIAYNNPYYGYMKTAYINNLYANNNCSGSNFCPNDFMTVRNAYVILVRFMNSLSNPRLNPTSSNYYQPNTITIESAGNPVGIDRAIFTHYEDESFNIKGGGLPLHFSHSYYSHLTDLPRFNRNGFENRMESQRYSPLGVGWTHTYNINAQLIESYDNTKQERIYFWWEDGTQDVYNYTLSKWESDNGRYLDIRIIAGLGGGTYIDTIWVTKNKNLTYKFSLRSIEATCYNLIEIRDRNDNVIKLDYEIGNNLGISYTVYRLKTVTDMVSNRSLSFDYQAGTNYISRVTDNSGRFVTYSVNLVKEDLDSFHDAENGRYWYTYGSNTFDYHLLYTIFKPKGNMMNVDYQNRKLKQIKTNTYVTDVSFQPNYANTNISTTTKLITTQNGQTNEKSIKHNDKGLPAIIHDSSQYMVYFYEDVNNPNLPTKINDENRQIYYEFEYDSRGNVTLKKKGSFSGAFFQKETYQYSSLWNVPRFYSDPKGYTTEYLIDNVNGNVFGIKYPDNTQTSFQRNTNGNIKLITLPDNKTVTLQYNQYGNLSLNMAIRVHQIK